MSPRRRRGNGAAIAGSLLVMALALPTAHAAPAPGSTERISVAADGSEVDAEARRPSISDDGRYVLFETDGPLIPQDEDTGFDIYLRDRSAGTLQLVSNAPGGVRANDESYAAFMTPGARFVGFVSKASNLVPGDTARCVEAITGDDISCPDIFVIDRTSGAIERVSVSTFEIQADKESHNGVAITPDGRYVAYWSDAINLVPGDTNSRGDIFLRDRLLGTTERVSLGAGGVQANAAASFPSLTSDGRYVAFSSYATNLAGVDTNQGTFSDVYVHDRVTKQTERVSVSSDGMEGNANSSHPVISGDGRYVAFESEATNLIPGDTNVHASDIYVHDRSTGRTDRVSLSSAGVEANGRSYRPAMSPNGRFISFASEASNLAPDDTQACVVNEIQGNASCRDLFVHDRATGQTDRITMPVGGAQNDGHSLESRLTSDGRSVVYESGATTLVADDGNSRPDIFLRDRGPGTGVGALQTEPSGDHLDISGWARFGGIAVGDEDEPADAGPGARPAGLELIGATASFQPEEGQVLMRLDLAELPPGPRPMFLSPRLGSLPAVVYGISFVAAGARYEVRVTRGGATASGLAPFALYRCQPSCAFVAALTGGIGAAGEEIAASAPISALGPATSLTDIRAFTGLGESLPGAGVVVDDVRLPALGLGAPSVTVGIAAIGTAEEDVDFEVPAGLTAGSFTATVDTSGLAPGAYEVWARACAAGACGARSIPIQL